MGYLNVKKINDEKKYYWTVSKRDGKKSGGTGKVKKIEFYLGDHNYFFYQHFHHDGYDLAKYGFQYLSWYIWNCDIKLDDFIDKFVGFEIKSMYGCDQLDFTLTNQNKVIFIKKKNATIDLREKYFKHKKTYINELIEDIIKTINYFPSMIREMLGDMKNYNICINKAKQVNKKINIDHYIYWENWANYWFNWVDKDVERMIDHVPRTQREEAKKKIWGYCLQRCPLEKLDL